MSLPPLSFNDLLSAVATAPVAGVAAAPAAVSTSAPAEASSPAASLAGKKRGPKKKDVAATKKKRGPKPKAAVDLRGHCVSVRMNAAELAALDQRRGEFQRGEWMRLAEAGALPPPPPSELNIEAWRKLATALGNLNQIAHALNIDAAAGGIRVTLDAEIKQALAEVRALRNALIGADLPRAAAAARAERKGKTAKKSPEPGGV